MSTATMATAELTRAQVDHERAEAEHKEATLAYQRLPGLVAPTVRDAARQRRTEAAGILRTAGEWLASARTALAQHRATEPQRQRQTTDEQSRNREAERRAADEAAFEARRRGQSGGVPRPGRCTGEPQTTRRGVRRTTGAD